MNELLDFISFTHAFRKVEREMYYPESQSKETDLEHSYQLALVAWFIVSTRKFPLDLSLIIKYALVHDLAKAYAGDVMFYRTEKESKEKEKREREAREKIKKQFPDFRDMHHLIDQYEKRATKESQFVYALDKLLPVINIYLDGGRIWKEHNITFDMLSENKKDKIKISPEIKKYFDEFLETLEKNQKMFSESTSASTKK